MDAEPLTSVGTVLISPVLITCTLPRKKKTSLAIHTKLSMCRVSPHICLIRRQEGDTGRRGGLEKTGSDSLFTQCRGLTP
ncbi:unnamed protein product [Staurois parvus]|uniref:Uncharacterized protein n=1 Tax=Staurois parvus TaxID=386267 RepID=A0ABN9DFA9_9NEOB|nr:unnamed protein product [Staurois parvus]